MKDIQFYDREMTPVEFDQMNAGFAEHGAAFGNPPGPSIRLTTVALDGDSFVGCASGLRHDQDNWFFLTDLFIVKAYRKRGLGAAVLRQLEGQVADIGARVIWTWTAGYEAPGFYHKQGYQTFCEQEDYYPTGHSRVGLRKQLDWS